MNPVPFPAPGVGVGREAPGLRLPADDGRQVDLADFRGRPVLVSFLSHAA
jgi:peroxiredoxin